MYLIIINLLFVFLLFFFGGGGSIFKGKRDLALSIFNKCKQNVFVQIQLNKCDKCNVI